MIDWLTLIVPLPHSSPIGGGRVFSLDASGEVEWTTHKRLELVGSHSTKLFARTCEHTPELCSHIEISGNPVKYFQGHNLWGTDDTHALAVATCIHMAQVLGLPVDASTIDLWRLGDYQLNRIDVTDSFHLAGVGEVRAWIRSAEQTAHLPYRGRGTLKKGSTLYFGMNSRRWSLKFYAKGDEIRKKGHGQDAIKDLPSAVAWADRSLRVELTLRSMELKRIGLSHGRDWLPVDGVPSVVTAELLRDRLGDMTMTTTSTLPEAALQELSNAQRTAYLAWVAGNDLREILPHNSFYRLRRKLLPHGVDIATLMPKDVSNVVPLYRVLEAKPAEVPDWAYGTSLFYEPPRVA